MRKNNKTRYPRSLKNLKTVRNLENNVNLSSLAGSMDLKTRYLYNFHLTFPALNDINMYSYCKQNQVGIAKHKKKSIRTVQ